MRGINKKFFGPTGIPILYNNGSTVVSGYIVRQLSVNNFIVSSDGDATYVVRMIENKTDGLSPPPGRFSIRVTTSKGDDYVAHLSNTRIVTTSGESALWGFDITPNAIYASIPTTPIIIGSSGLTVGSIFMATIF